MSSPRIELGQNEIAAFCREHGVKRLSIFGSVLRDHFDPQASDVDVLVEFAPGVHKGLFKLVAMQNALSKMLGRNVDVTTPGSLSKYCREEVLTRAVVLYDAA